jgi:hypothetical protein
METEKKCYLNFAITDAYSKKIMGYYVCWQHVIQKTVLKALVWLQTEKVRKHQWGFIISDSFYVGTGMITKTK